MRPVSVFANGPCGEIKQLQAALRGRWRQAARAVMVCVPRIASTALTSRVARPTPRP